MLLQLLLFYPLFAVATIFSPASIPETWPSFNSTPDLPITDSITIAKTAAIIDQKSGAVGNSNQPIPKVFVTAIDGKLVLAPSSSPSSFKSARAVTRSLSDYELVFNGTGTSSNARDAAIQGTAYLTFSFVNNSTYNIQDCLRFCDSVPPCTFANLYYEFTDAPSNDPSNLKCVLYADVHSANEKSNWGNQSYIQHSSAWSLKSLVDPHTPQGYDYVFGPINAANNARYYMGFVFLDRYDVSACAQECNNRSPDPVGGACQYFNIWRALLNDTPTTYTCSMYFHPTDSSTATNTGQASLKVSFSRAYKRTNYIIDGSFESFPPPSSSCPFSVFCYLPSSSTWSGTSPPSGTLDAVVFLFQPLAHFGLTFGLLGSVSHSDSLPGTLAPVSPLQTIPGKSYVIGFFHQSSFSTPELEAGAFVDVVWNGNVVRELRPGWSTWKYYTVQVVAVGQDRMAFHGGSAPAWSFIDDVTLFEI